MENRLIRDGIEYVIISEQEYEEFEFLKHKEKLRNIVKEIKQGKRVGVSLDEFKRRLDIKR